MQLVSFSLQGNSPQGAQRYPRLLFSIPITLHHLMTGGIRSSHGVSLDISEGGLGALVEAKLRSWRYDRNRTELARLRSERRGNCALHDQRTIGI